MIPSTAQHIGNVVICGVTLERYTMGVFLGEWLRGYTNDPEVAVRVVDALRRGIERWDRFDWELVEDGTGRFMIWAYKAQKYR